MHEQPQPAPTGSGPVLATVRVEDGLAAVRLASGRIVGIYAGDALELHAGDTVVNDAGRCRIDWADGSAPTLLAGPVELTVGRRRSEASHWRWMFAKLHSEAPTVPEPETSEDGAPPYAYGGLEEFGDFEDVEY